MADITHYPVTRYSVDDGLSSHATEAAAFSEARSWTDPALRGEPIEMHTFEICGFCGPLELLIAGRDDYMDSIWPCAASRNVGRDVDLDDLIHAAVEQERTRQETELGYTAAHDDKHGVDHLSSWAMTYRKRGKYIKALALLKAYDEAWDRQVEVVRAETRKQIDRAKGRRRDH